MDKLSPSKRITLSAMTVALNVLALYGASNLPTGRIACFFMSAVFICVLTSEELYINALLTFAASSLAALLIVPNKTAIVPYIALLGHFMIFKQFVSLKIEDKVISFALRIIYCNVFTAAAVAVAIYILKLDIEALLPKLPLYLLVLIGETGFIALDFLSSLAQNIYIGRIRRSLIGNQK
ncbi:MAG: hypothetical protein SPK56_07610 [Eubacteriales bacterium]|nr:hypothetical protein [Clostridiales bacterium]MDY5733022.1 hypothetical protein [Eubacteriales bacterium]